jgi:hypothetical protein
LKHCDVVNFACHGVSDLTNPSNSSLILQKILEPDSKLASDNLTVQQISENNLTQPKITYLSACSIVENRAQELADEVIHLASGFQVAGFAHVIGSMWPSCDDVCVKVAKTFYQRMGICGLTSAKTVASALRELVNEVRSQSPKQPLLWVQYTHRGTWMRSPSIPPAFQRRRYVNLLNCMVSSLLLKELPLLPLGVRPRPQVLLARHRQQQRLPLRIKLLSSSLKFLSIPPTWLGRPATVQKHIFARPLCVILCCWAVPDCLEGFLPEFTVEFIFSNNGTKKPRSDVIHIQ